MKGLVRFALLASCLAVTAATSVSSQLPNLAPCRYSCVTLGTRPIQVVRYSFNSTYAQCCNADTTYFCDPGQALLGLSWGDPAAKCAP